MAIEHENEDGTTITVFTKEEVEAEATTRAQAEATRIANEKDAEIEKLRKVSAEKTENFRKYNEMSEEEKKAHSENEIIQIRRADQLAEELTSVKTALQEKEAREKDYTKNSILKGFHGDKEDVKKNLEEKYAVLAGMPESTPDEIKVSLTGIWFRVNDKVQRLKQLVLLSKQDMVGESIADSFVDMSVYGFIAQIVSRGKWGK